MEKHEVAKYINISPSYYKMSDEFYRRMRHSAHKCITVLVLGCDQKAVANCLRGMRLRNICNEESYNNLHKLGVNKTVFVEKKGSPRGTSSTQRIEEHDFDKLKNRRYDMLVIDDESLTENEIRSHLEAFIGNINCFIFVNGQAPSSSWDLARGWDVKSSGTWAEWSRNYEDVWRKADFENHRKSYETLERLSHMLVGSKIVYRLAGYDCLACHLFNGRSVFAGSTEICIHVDYLGSLISTLRANRITPVRSSPGCLTIKVSSIVTSLCLYRTRMQDNRRIFEFIDDPNIAFGVQEAGGTPVLRRFGPIRAYTFKNPSPYLTKKFGYDFMNTIRFPLLGEISHHPRILYSDCYDYYSHDRSDKWRAELINAGKEVARIFEDNGIKCWLDGGALLGAVRNNDIPPGDDDIDLGVFTTAVDKLYKLKLPRCFSIQDRLGNDCVVRKEKHGILYDVEILTYFRNANDRYQCNRFRDTRSMADRARKCAVPIMFFDTLNTVALGSHSFACPMKPVVYVELPEKYGPGCIDADPRPHAKSGSQEWLSNFQDGPPGLRY